MIRLPPLFQQRSYVWIVHGIIAILGALLFCIAWVSGQPVVSPEMFGPAVYQVPAEAWGAGIALSSGAMCVGLLWCRRALIAVGAALGMLTYGFLLVMADTAVAGDIGRLFASMPFALHAIPLAQLIQERIDDR